MNNITIETKLGQVCSCYIDYGRRIGNDPVGHRCSNYATTDYYVDGIGFMICQSCKEALDTEKDGSRRVTLNPHRYFIPEG